MPLEYRHLELHNIGPIGNASIDSKRITVFFGPNNSGKSITALTLYSLAKEMLEDAPINGWGLQRAIARYLSGLDGFSWSRAMRAVISQGKKSGEVRVGFKVKNHDFDVSLEFLSKQEGDTRIRPSLAKLNRVLVGIRESHETELDVIYVPAARAGILQTFYPLMYLKNTILRDLQALAARGGERRFYTSRLPLMLPQLEEFYELLFRTLIRADLAELNKALGEVIGGETSIFPSELIARRTIPTILYRDTSGFTTEIERTGSGILELFPFLLFLDKIRPKGLLFVEEPEAHCEVRTQEKLVKLIARMCLAKKVSAVLTTHSDWILFSLLALVSKGELRRDQLAIYEFKRPQRERTRVREITIDERGKTEGLHPFEEVLSSLEKADLAAALR